MMTAVAMPLVPTEISDVPTALSMSITALKSGPGNTRNPRQDLADHSQDVLRSSSVVSLPTRGPSPISGTASAKSL